MKKKKPVVTDKDLENFYSLPEFGRPQKHQQLSKKQLSKLVNTLNKQGEK